MSDLPSLDLVNFKELHLLPRTIFLIGGLTFLGSFYLHSFGIGLLGLAAIFLAVGLNVFVDYKIANKKTTDTEDARFKRLRAWGTFQMFACVLIAVALICYAAAHCAIPSWWAARS